MYCPNCGQQQVSDRMRFCARCGFSLIGVFSARRNEVIQGLLLMALGVVFLPYLYGVLIGVNEALKDTGFQLPPDLFLNLLSILFFIGGILRILFALSVERSARRRYKEQPASPPSPPARLTQRDLPSHPAVAPATQKAPVTASDVRQAETAKTERLPDVTGDTAKIADK